MQARKMQGSKNNNQNDVVTFQNQENINMGQVYTNGGNQSERESLPPKTLPNGAIYTG